MVERERLLAWVDEAFRVGRWPSQLQNREAEFRETYKMLRALLKGDAARIPAAKFKAGGRHAKKAR